MNKDQYLQHIKNFFEDCLKIVEKKSGDYADVDDSFKNFKGSEVFCNISLEKGILVRMTDKMMRIGNLLEREAEVSDEKITDTLQDLANYSAILATYLCKK